MTTPAGAAAEDDKNKNKNNNDDSKKYGRKAKEIIEKKKQEENQEALMRAIISSVEGSLERGAKKIDIKIDEKTGGLSIEDDGGRGLDSPEEAKELYRRMSVAAEKAVIDYRNKEEEEEEEGEGSKDKDEEMLEAEKRVFTGLYKLLRSFSADLEHPENRWAVGQAILFLYLYVKNKDLFSNVRAEDLDDWFREELNFVRNEIHEHEEGEKEEGDSSAAS